MKKENIAFALFIAYILALFLFGAPRPHTATATTSNPKAETQK